ncbi:prepilin-type N-terminal cleavage/methylation domain-containing protein [Candidatus Berkelbacteria bacterium]|nr:prepilin-type N-terminal cleavage/methylation domain-containing protein [Candidatus Berkelbacteria bacterium]
MNLHRSKQRGFTLLELLVVVAIIAILAAVIVANLNSARSKANDAKVKQDLNGVDQALAVATADPSVLGSAPLNALNNGGGVLVDIDTETALTVNGYLKTFPIPPSGITQYNYRSNYSNGIFGYVLWGTLSTKTGANNDCWVINTGNAFQSNGCLAADTTGVTLP